MCEPDSVENEHILTLTAIIALLLTSCLESPVNAGSPVDPIVFGETVLGIETENYLREKQIEYFGDFIIGRPIKIDPAELGNTCFANGKCYDFNALPEPWYLSVRNSEDYLVLKSNPQHFTISAPMFIVAEQSWFGEIKSTDFDYSYLGRYFINITILQDGSHSQFRILRSGKSVSDRAISSDATEFGDNAFSPPIRNDFYTYFDRKTNAVPCNKSEYSVFITKLSPQTGEPYVESGNSYIVDADVTFAAKVRAKYLRSNRTSIPSAVYSYESFVHAEVISTDGDFFLMGFPTGYAPIIPELRCEVEGVIKEILMKGNNRR